MWKPSLTFFPTENMVTCIIAVGFWGEVIRNLQVCKEMPPVNHGALISDECGALFQCVYQGMIQESPPEGRLTCYLCSPFRQYPYDEIHPIKKGDTNFDPDFSWRVHHYHLGPGSYSGQHNSLTSVVMDDRITIGFLLAVKVTSVQSLTYPLYLD